MPIYLDNEPADLSGGDLKSLLVSAQQQLAPAGRVVVEVLLDNEPLVGERLSAMADAAIDGARELRLVSADPVALSLQTLDEVGQRLNNARAIQQEAAELLQRDEPADGLAKVGEAVAVWMQVQQAIEQVGATLQIDLASLTAGSKNMTEVTDALIGGLREVKEHIVGQDTVALADAFAYEWDERCDEWQALLDDLTRRVENMNPENT